jgi:hypothetical protein
VLSDGRALLTKPSKSHLVDVHCYKNPKSAPFKRIVSRDFEVCFLVLLDSSDIATPDGTVFLKSRFRDEFSIIQALALVVFPVSESQLRERPQLIS